MQNVKLIFNICLHPDFFSDTILQALSFVLR